jgi:predicted metalloprotease with PDZ domain
MLYVALAVVGITYTIRPVPAEDRTDLQITVEFIGDADGRTRITLPDDWYGTPRIWEAVTSLVAVDATIEAVPDQPARRDVVHEAGAPVRLQYTLSWDPTAHTGYAYRPSVGPEHFHFFGAQWRIGVDRPDPQVYTIQYRDVPAGWKVFSSLGAGAGPYRSRAVDAELAPLIAGGDYASAEFTTEGGPVAVYVRGFDDARDVVVRTQATVIMEREFFGDQGQPFYLVCVSPRDDIQAGVAIDNAFVLLTDAGTESSSLDVLLAHETFHNWLSGDLGLTPLVKSTIDAYKFDWFVEGFTEYAARRLLADAGRLTDDQLVVEFNDDMRELALNPQRTKTLAEIEASSEAGVFTNRHERLSYVRGPLMAMMWERRLEAAGGPPLMEIVREIILDAADLEGGLHESRIFEAFAAHGVDAKGDYERYIIRGEPIVPPADLFAPDFVFEPEVVHLYDPGFGVRATRRSGEVTEVVAGGPADRAGLRDGMPVVSVESRHRATHQVRVRVRENGGERVIEFLPRGRAVETGRFIRSGAPAGGGTE